MDQKRQLLPVDFGETGPFAKIGKALNLIGRMINGLHFADGGSVITTRDFIRLRPESLANGNFSGTAYVAGVKTTGLNSDPAKGWVMVNASTTTATQVYAAQVVTPFPPNVEFYEKTYTYGDIHLPRL